ncbi:MAG: class I SAM-dependent methyltransferase [Myxococcota bacterium]
MSRLKSTVLVGIPLATACASSHHHDGSGFHHRFDNPAKWAETFDAADRDAWQHPDELVAVMEIGPGMSVADIGAGTGYFLPYLSRAVGDAGKVHALDIEAEMVEYMRARAQREVLSNVVARQVDPNDPGIAPSSVDRIVIIDTWHHIDQRPAYAKKLFDALKPGGTVCIVDFTLEAEQGPPREHRLAPERVIEELGTAGLQASVVHEELPDQYVVCGKRAS